MRFGQWLKSGDPRWSAKWKRLRTRVLRRYPRCEVVGCEALSEQVHHVQRVTHRPDLAFTWSNLRAVCPACHPKADKNLATWKPRAGPDLVL